MEIILEIRADIGAGEKVLKGVGVLPIVYFAIRIGAIISRPGTVCLEVEIVQLISVCPAGIFRPVVDPVLGIQLDKMVDLEIAIEALDNVDLVVETGRILLLIIWVEGVDAHEIGHLVGRTGPIGQFIAQIEEWRGIEKRIDYPIIAVLIAGTITGSAGAAKTRRDRIAAIDDLRDRPEPETLEQFHAQVGREVAPVQVAGLHNRGNGMAIGSGEIEITSVRTSRNADHVVVGAPRLEDLFEMI